MVSNSNPPGEACLESEKVILTHQLFKELLQWRMEDRGFNLEYHWKEPESIGKVSLKEIFFKELMKIKTGLNCKKFKILKGMAAMITENQATILAIADQWKQRENTLMFSGSRVVVNQLNSQVDSYHSCTNRSGDKSHNYSQSQILSRGGVGS
ncbi:hypothetical protein O181_132138 [Austropuccinia psidii MF-1]|uniref:Uncharacterized protein n=1 Tax=Austropuccinia psidii MF-1 TaxID=1389203 RepID=A0A9Q3L1S7_9BASI|nr:hypothetical protein [Austropuccinia psidii MF-1]